MLQRKFYYLSAGIVYLFFLPAFVLGQTPAPTPSEEPAVTTETSTKAKESDEMPTPSSTPEIINSVKAEDLIHLGDLIDVDVLGSAEYDWRGKLNPEGFLSGVNYIEEPVLAKCRSVEAVAVDIAKGLSKFLNTPQVVVRIIDRSGRPISALFGAVKTPQRFQIQRNVRLNELLILSGGITEKSSGEIQIVRPPSLSCDSRQINIDEEQLTENEPKKELISKTTKAADDSETINIRISDLLKGKPNSNPIIFNGDIITVLEAQPIYVIGGVVNPKQINARSELKVSRAIAMAGGFTKYADQKNITIFRKNKGETQIIEVDLEKIKISEENDIVLQAFDIVEVGQNGRKKNKFPPVVNVLDNREANASAIATPVRIIN